ncbi:MAG: hypothetical protein U5K75_09645 [Ahrensia sp.]|nr:hypothetical protein [Ahrensia sp.]
MAEVCGGPARGRYSGRTARTITGGGGEGSDGRGKETEEGGIKRRLKGGKGRRINQRKREKRFIESQGEGRLKRCPRGGEEKRGEEITIKQPYRAPPRLLQEKAKKRGKKNGPRGKRLCFSFTLNVLSCQIKGSFFAKHVIKIDEGARTYTMVEYDKKNWLKVFDHSNRLRLVVLGAP